MLDLNIAAWRRERSWSESVEKKKLSMKRVNSFVNQVTHAGRIEASFGFSVHIELIFLVLPRVLNSNGFVAASLTIATHYVSAFDHVQRLFAVFFLCEIDCSELFQGILSRIRR